MQEGIFEEFSKAVVEKVNKFKLGGGMDPNTTLGPSSPRLQLTGYAPALSLFGPLFAPLFGPLFCICWTTCESVATNGTDTSVFCPAFSVSWAPELPSLLFPCASVG